MEEVTTNTNTVEVHNNEPSSNRVYVLFYSFFLIPLMIAVIGTSLFIIVNFLTMEPKTHLDLLNDVKIGSASKRWQSAFELSKIIVNKKDIVNDDLFRNQLISAYKSSIHDDEKVRMYLAMTMGRTGDTYYGDYLLEGLNDENSITRLASIKAIGLLSYKSSVPYLINMLKNKKYDLVEYHSIIVSLGNIGDKNIVNELIPFLEHEEANIRWDTALSLAKLDNRSGIEIIGCLLDRNYYMDYPEVDTKEENQAILVAMEVSSRFKDDILEKKLRTLALKDQNMKIRDSAIKTLNKVYGS